MLQWLPASYCRDLAGFWFDNCRWGLLLVLVSLRRLFAVSVWGMFFSVKLFMVLVFMGMLLVVLFFMMVFMLVIIPLGMTVVFFTQLLPLLCGWSVAVLMIVLYFLRLVFLWIRLLAVFFFVTSGRVMFMGAKRLLFRICLLILLWSGFVFLNSCLLLLRLLCVLWNLFFLSLLWLFVAKLLPLFRIFFSWMFVVLMFVVLVLVIYFAMLFMVVEWRSTVVALLWFFVLVVMWRNLVSGLSPLVRIVRSFF